MRFSCLSIQDLGRKRGAGGVGKPAWEDKPSVELMNKGCIGAWWHCAHTWGACVTHVSCPRAARGSKLPEPPIGKATSLISEENTLDPRVLRRRKCEL